LPRGTSEIACQSSPPPSPLSDEAEHDARLGAETREPRQRRVVACVTMFIKARTL
jgi:hypothetical protein